jgi:hypothetical protein
VPGFFFVEIAQQIRQSKTAKQSGGAIDVELPNAKVGEVVVRFGESPSGWARSAFPGRIPV